MDREEMIDDAIAAMDRIADMDVTFRQYATAVVDALGWRGFDNKPERGSLILCTGDGARWMATYFDDVPEWSGHTAAPWHPVHDTPR